MYFSSSEAWLYFYLASVERMILIHLYVIVSSMCLTNTAAIFWVIIYFTCFNKVALKASLIKVKKKSLRLVFNISTSCHSLLGEQ